MKAYFTMNAREQFAWTKALLEGTLWPYKDDYEATEQMVLWRQVGHLLKEIGSAASLTIGAVSARVRNYEKREGQHD